MVYHETDWKLDKKGQKLQIETFFDFQCGLMPFEDSNFRLVYSNGLDGQLQVGKVIGDPDREQTSNITFSQGSDRYSKLEFNYLPELQDIKVTEQVYFVGNLTAFTSPQSVKFVNESMYSMFQMSDDVKLLFTGVEHQIFKQQIAPSVLAVRSEHLIQKGKNATSKLLGVLLSAGDLETHSLYFNPLSNVNSNGKVPLAPFQDQVTEIQFQFDFDRRVVVTDYVNFMDILAHLGGVLASLLLLSF